MNDRRHSSNQRRVSSVNISADDVDLSDAHDFGKAIFAVLYRLIRIGAIYSPTNELTENAIGSFMELFGEAMSRRSDDGVDVEIRGDFVTINGETLRLGPTARERLRELRNVFVEVGFYRIHFQRGLTGDDLSRLVGHLRRVIESDHVDDMDAVDIAHIRVFAGRPTRSLRDALDDVDLARYEAHLYTRFLVIVRNAARQFQKAGELEMPTGALRRITRRLASVFRIGSRRLLGWLPEGILKSSHATHSVHSAIYAVFLAERLDYALAPAGELGAGVVLEDLQWLERSSEPGERPASGLPNTKARRENIDALMTRTGSEYASPADAYRQQLLFERGFPITSPFDEGGEEGTSVSLATRIADVARTYAADLHGFRQSRHFGPTDALHRLEARAGEALDGSVVEAFVEAMGTYPPGTKVRLSNGVRGQVGAPPGPGAPPDRPTVATESSPDDALDLADQLNASLAIAAATRGDGDGDEDQAHDWFDDLYLMR